MMQLTPSQIKKIDLIPGDDEWWNESGKETFVNAATEMLEAGLDFESVVRLLATLYHAVANEFGS